MCSTHILTLSAHVRREGTNPQQNVRGALLKMEQVATNLVRIHVEPQNARSLTHNAT